MALDFIAHLLQEASALVRERYADRTDLHVASKKHANDLLTETDLAVQDLIVARIRGAFPNDAIAAEERDLARAPDNPDAPCWVIDPVDGTQNFVHGLFPTFGISIAFARGGNAVAGGVALPIGGDMFLAERGMGASLNGRALHVSDVNPLNVARVEVDFSGPPERNETLARADVVLRTAGQIRCNCATVVALCSIAAAEMEAFFHVALHPWDYAAGGLIVEEAGGTVSRLDGSPLRLFDGRRGVLASNGAIHEELLGILR